MAEEEIGGGRIRVGKPRSGSSAMTIVEPGNVRLLLTPLYLAALRANDF